MQLITVGWVEATKPFDSAAPERSRRAGQAQHNLVLLGFAIAQPNLLSFLRSGVIICHQS